MAALTREWPRDPATETIEGRVLMDVGANMKIWKGADLVVDTRTGSATRGYVLPAGTQTTVSAVTNSTGQFYRGRARTSVDNTGGANGALQVEVELARPVYVVWHEMSGTNVPTLADRGSLGYSEDDHTVGNLSTGLSSAGRIWDVDAIGGIVATEVPA